MYNNKIGIVEFDKDEEVNLFKTYLKYMKNEISSFTNMINYPLTMNFHVFKHVVPIEINVEEKKESLC